jgi:hypothetical protein
LIEKALAEFVLLQARLGIPLRGSWSSPSWSSPK